MSRVWQRYKLRVLRRHLLWRAFRARHELRVVANRTASIGSDAILCVATVRNEAVRLPYFLDHYRRLGVSHFLFVDNDSTDATSELLADQPDVSLWSTSASYKEARFGLDWTTWLQMRYAHGKWCLTLDADELLIYPHHETQSLRDLTRFLDDINVRAMGALMLELYPKEGINQVEYAPGQNPLEILRYFDSGPYRSERQKPKNNLWVQGGVRERVFFARNRRRGPTLNKLPLVKWHWRYAYVNSTHAMLPQKLNLAYDGPGQVHLSGVLLHTKFLSIVVEKSAEEKQRRQHFSDPDLFSAYYDELIAGPTLWHESSVAYEGWRQLEMLGLMSRGDWKV
ncbi:glycosyl transferase family 2 [Celeribacter persicus]|uniref:Glycosyl transferase family 2 n=1 Tax=Celeribacter persicus TaxID=1651082 RepID=A0A2T5HDV7_9RHOB|nr:glycosyl transferase family 2 [Celeribacter persicus]